ncbi:MAG TPA: hypothetical protein VLA16_19725, partial [Ideonella sp.]|nr:hypothetical protein [Ideonella sp.]
MSSRFRHCIADHMVLDDTGRPALTPQPDWGGLPMAIGVIPGNEELRDVWSGVPTLLLERSGSGRRWYRRGLVTRELATRPRMIELYAQDFQLEQARWQGEAGRCVGLQFPRDAHRQVLQAGGDPHLDRELVALAA